MDTLTVYRKSIYSMRDVLIFFFFGLLVSAITFLEPENPSYILGYIFFIIFTLFAFFIWWDIVRESRSKVTFCHSNHQIYIEELTILGRKKTSFYSLNKFASVRSIIAKSSKDTPENLVELISTSGNWGLLIARFSTPSSNNFFSIPHQLENPDANALCKSISLYTSLHNNGFEGSKFEKTPIAADLQ